jgi:hypothetical protein
VIAADKPPLSEAYLAHISERPWSTYTKADYTPEQWHRACLIHQHQGAPTSKNQCKIPVRTPNGALNRNGVHAAMAALNGARGGVDATTDEKMRARGALSKLYKQLGEEAPGFSAKHDAMSDDDRLVHFGIKGMKWGQRKSRSSGGSGESSDKPKRSVGQKIALGVTIAAGAAAAAYFLNKRGNNPVKGLIERSYSDRAGAKSMQRAQAKARDSIRKSAGMKTRVSDISQTEWKSRVNSVLADMKQANADQDSYMRSLGLGAVVNRSD